MKELIFLDCLHQYYFGNRKQLIPDEDYEELKEQLTWEGTEVFSVSACHITLFAVIRLHGDHLDWKRSAIHYRRSGIEKVLLEMIEFYFHVLLHCRTWMQRGGSHER